MGLIGSDSIKCRVEVHKLCSCMHVFILQVGEQNMERSFDCVLCGSAGVVYKLMQIYGGSSTVPDVL